MPICIHLLSRGARPTGKQGGNILIYVIVVMMLFAALGTALVSIYTTSNLMAVISDDAKAARYLAESGVRYAMAELQPPNYTRKAIQTLNSTEYAMSSGDTFDINVFPKWFLAAATVSIPSGGGPINLNVPDSATIPSGFTINTGIYLVNIDSLRDAIAFAGGNTSLFIAKVSADSTNVDDDTLRVEIGDPFEVSENQPILMAAYPDSATYSAGTETAISVDGTGNIVIGGDSVPAEAAFHEEGGTFYVLNPSTGVRRMYSYDAYTVNSPVTLTNIRGLESLSIDPARDLIIFSDKNHTITAQGKTGPSSSEALESVQIDIPQNTSSAPLWAPENPEETPADINITNILSTAATPASTSGTVEIDTVNQQIKLGLGVGSAYSAVWYGGTRNVGGVSGNFCSAGKCKFEYGMRAYFTVDYNGTGDGFTFTVMNGSGNTTSSTGAGGEYLGYAGTGSGGGIQPPKLALEFDTYTNDGRNDPGSSNKDYLNFDFWGVSDSDLNDDNIHDTWESESTLSNNVRCTPYVESSGDILVVSTDGWLYRIDSKGESTDSFNLGASSDSSPIVDGAGHIWVGTNDNYINVVNSTLTAFLGNPFTRNVGGNVRTTPAYDSVTGRVFLGSDYSGTLSPAGNQCNFCVFNAGTGSFQWGHNSGDVIQGSPRIKNGYVYFGGNSGGGDVWKYYASGSKTPASNWSSPYTTDSDVQVRPAVSSSGTVYFGSWENDSYFHAVKTDKTLKWTTNFDTGFVSIFSSAALDESRNRVYFGTTEIRSGSYDGKVYALNLETGALVWSYQTGGAIYSSPAVGNDGAVYIGSDDGYLYAFEPEGNLRWKIDLKDEVRSSPALSSGNTVAYVGSDDNRLFSVPVTGNPWQFKTWDDTISGTTYYRHLTYGDNLPSSALAADNPISSSDNWLNSGPWAVRVEVERSQTANSNGMYDYTIRSWIRQCKLDPGDCSEITGTYFSDTRIAYEAKPAQMSQSFELSETDHQAFETYYNGFTQATGGATQTVTIRNIRIGFIRPGDYIVVSDSDWQ